MAVNLKMTHQLQGEDAWQEESWAEERERDEEEPPHK